MQKVSSDSPALSPADALQTFYMPPGYHVELVASEPLVQDPVAIDWDVDGRLWVVEMPGYMRTMLAADEHDPLGRIVVLQDTDRDGRMDTRTVFADGLVLARSVKVLDRGVLVAEPPNLWLMRDTDGDLRADARTLVTGEFGRLEIDPENNANGFDWALDNRLYTAGQADVLLRTSHGVLGATRTLARGQWGVTHDDAGRTYRNTNESALHVDLVPTPYYARNPNLLRTRGSYERLADDGNELNTVWPVRPNPGTNRAYQTGIDRPDGSLARFTSACAPLVYRGDRLPAELYGNVFVAEPAANLVSRIVLDDSGGMVRARKAYDRGEFLASTDERFRPVYLSNAPDGTLYVVDLYRGVIEHRISITSYLREQIVARGLEQPLGFGRIYRVVHDGVQRDATPVPSTSTRSLVDMLSHPNGWRRDTAQRLLVERWPEDQARADRAAVADLEHLATGAASARTRLHALWTLDGADAITPSTVLTALQDASPDVRASAIRVAERWMGEADHPVQRAVLQRIDDPSGVVRWQLAASLGALPPGAPRDAAFVTLLARHGDDPVVVDAALSGLRGSEAAVLDGLMRALDGPAPTSDAAITMLAATIIRSAQEAPAQRVFAWAAEDSRVTWQRSALLRGAEVALLGAATPGAVAPLRIPEGLPCPTCPGGRAGPGGGYAFGGPPAPPSVAARRPGLVLNREPAALVRLASAADGLGARIAGVLARVSWPGKPGDADPLPPLTAVEQRRFEAGHEIYQNLCQACHQPDGRGQDRLAASLLGSVLLQAPPGIPARVLLNGKEGVVGLMPPVGATLTDEQIASVLTYVRREWGQAGTPVDPATVGAVRAATAARTRPWTDGELRALAETGR